MKSTDIADIPVCSLFDRMIAPLTYAPVPLPLSCRTVSGSAARGCCLGDACGHEMSETSCPGDTDDSTSLSLQQLSRTAPTVLDTPTPPHEEDISDSEEVLGGMESTESAKFGMGRKEDGVNPSQPGVGLVLEEREALSDVGEAETGSACSADSQGRGYSGSQKSDCSEDDLHVVSSPLATSQSSLGSELGPPYHLPASQLQQ